VPYSLESEMPRIVADIVAGATRAKVCTVILKPLPKRDFEISSNLKGKRKQLKRGFKDFDVETKAIIWPCLSHVCHIRLRARCRAVTCYWLLATSYWSLVTINVDDFIDEANR